MKTEIPDALKADVPQSKWGKVLLSTPVIMTVVATLLAGLASSEMTRAQYDRSLAAQLQSKAGDQWGYFQAKKLRGALQHSTLDVIKSTAAVRPLEAAVLKPFGGLDPKTLPALQKGVKPFGELDAKTLAALETGELPETPAAALDPNLKAALGAVENSKPEADIAALLVAVPDQDLAAALIAARDRAQAFDNTVKPITQDVEQRERALAAVGSTDLTRDFTAARLRFAAARYDVEARLNQAIANLLELQVRKGNISAERHHRRSGRFFFGMLAAQAAVIVSTFSIAAQKRSALWTLAAAAGVAAIAFAIYVYFFV